MIQSGTVVVPTRPTLSIAALGAFGAAAALLILSLLLRAYAGELVALATAGDILDTNRKTGLTQETVAVLVGRIQFLTLACAALGTTLGAELFVRRSGRPSSIFAWIIRRPSMFAMIATGAFLAVTLEQNGLLHHGRSFFVLEDDAMISMRYARNFVDGIGLVYNPGERVEGYSNFLWVMVMALVHLAGIPDRLTAAVVLATECGITLAILALLDVLLRTWRVRPFIAIVLLLAFACDTNTVMWTASGLETMAIALAVTACAWALVTERAPVLFLVPLACLPLLRSDGAFLAALLGCGFLASARGKKAALAGLALAMAPAMLHLAFRLAYYGNLLPNTYYLKMFAPADRVRLGIGNYGLRFLSGYLVIIPLIAYVTLARQFGSRVRWLSALVFLQVAYATYLGGDAFWDLRFVEPVLPLAYACAALALDRLFASVAAPQLTALVTGLAMFCPFKAVGGKLGARILERDYNRAAIVTAELLRENVPPGSSVSISPAGLVPYFAPQYRFIDVLGKTESHIAHQSKYTGMVIGHNKFDYEWVYGARRPEIAITAFPCSLSEDYGHLPFDARQRGIAGVPAHVYVAPLFELNSEAFQQRYLPNRVLLPEQAKTLPIGCIYARDDAAIARKWSHVDH